MVNTRKRAYKDYTTNDDKKSREQILDKLVEITELNNILLEDLERNQPQINFLLNKQQKLLHELTKVNNDDNKLTTEEIQILQDAFNSDNESDFHTPTQSDSGSVDRVGANFLGLQETASEDSFQNSKPSKTRLERIGWGLQLPPPNLNLPNGVDDLERCVIIAYKQLGRIL